MILFLPPPRDAQNHAHPHPPLLSENEGRVYSQCADLPRGDASAPKPKPKPNPKPVSRQLSVSAFLSKYLDQVAMVLQEILGSAFCVTTSKVKNCMRDSILEV